jgi:hypothetical protein
VSDVQRFGARLSRGSINAASTQMHALAHTTAIRYKLSPGAGKIIYLLGQARSFISWGRQDHLSPGAGKMPTPRKVIFWGRHTYSPKSIFFVEV